MSIDRRKFLLITGGAAAAGLAGKQTLKVFAESEARKSEGFSGRRWAMLIDLKKCNETEGCTKCIDACHLAHNVPHYDNKKDEIKWIWKEKFEHAFIEQENEFIPSDIKNKPALLFCNHCENPPCVNVCPTQATWKRKDGIVMMDWHRCIGCRYCMAACPYGSRSFNWREPRPHLKELNPEFPTRTRGVVEKCTFCDERLAKGMKPACVEACPSKAMIFGDLEDPNSEIRVMLGSNFTMRRKPELGTQPEIYYII
ncbi:MAG: 4Fe-4S ferredoxin [Ignavibacteria bacterium GWB2_35_12]|nr:MAG: 4Fe-4S ferredoxin [Ignavibacteria bacterium GWB2_35_12]OGU90182.1 MAG: 4Fe-4S ferredoxin [Ignavibacteria bacterium RIFOXYA2_FULL_35_10]OGV21917.1 MAG: 4Fe-4S ferredoxin [Ignavibacteria bacterium RIFOXYC2_FULL_35_21]